LPVQTSYSIKYPLTIRIPTIEGYRTAMGFGVPNFKQAFPPQFRDQAELWLHCLPLHRESELAGLNYASAFVSPTMGKQMQVSRKVCSTAVWKQATVIALTIDVLNWACQNPEIVTSSSSRPLGVVALMACFNDVSFHELQELLQQVFESVIYNKVSLLAVELAPHMRNLPEHPPWNATREVQDRFTQQVTTVWENGTRTAYREVKHVFTLAFGEGLITAKHAVHITPDRVRLAIHCLNSTQSGPGGKIKWWDAQSILSGSFNQRGTDGEYAAQAFILTDSGERSAYGNRILTSNSSKKVDTPQTPQAPPPAGRPSIEPVSSQNTHQDDTVPSASEGHGMPRRERGPRRPSRPEQQQRTAQQLQQLQPSRHGQNGMRPPEFPAPSGQHPPDQEPPLPPSRPNTIPPPPFYGPLYGAHQRKRPRSAGGMVLRRPVNYRVDDFYDYEYDAELADYADHYYQ
jgi:hypothetical protein